MRPNIPRIDQKALDRLAKAVAKTEDLQQLVTLRNEAEAARRFAESTRLGLAIQNRAAEIRLRAERKAGEILGKLSTRGRRKNLSSHDENITLAKLGIDHNQSARWRLMATVPEEIFEQFVAAANERGEEITAAGLLRIARQLRGSKQRRGNGRATANHHPSHKPSRNGVKESGSLGHLVEEIRQHREILETILIPVCGGERAALTANDRHLILRLLNEIKELLTDLPD